MCTFRTFAHFHKNYAFVHSCFEKSCELATRPSLGLIQTSLISELCFDFLNTVTSQKNFYCLKKWPYLIYKSSSWNNVCQILSLMYWTACVMYTYFDSLNSIFFSNFCNLKKKNEIFLINDNGKKNQDVYARPYYGLPTAHFFCRNELQLDELVMVFSIFPSN